MRICLPVVLLAPCLAGCPVPPEQAQRSLPTSIVPGVYIGTGTLDSSCNTDSPPVQFTATTSFELTTDGRVIIDGTEMFVGAVLLSGSTGTQTVTNIAFSSNSVLIQYSTRSFSGLTGIDTTEFEKINDGEIHYSFDGQSVDSSLGLICTGKVSTTLRR